MVQLVAYFVFTAPFCCSVEELCTLVITEAYPEDSGIFKCVTENPLGTASCSALLEVYTGNLSTTLCRILSILFSLYRLRNNRNKQFVERPLSSALFQITPA